jgi:hypothetical protein
MLPVSVTSLPDPRTGRGPRSSPPVVTARSRRPPTTAYTDAQLRHFTQLAFGSDAGCESR